MCITMRSPVVVSIVSVTPVLTSHSIYLIVYHNNRNNKSHQKFLSDNRHVTWREEKIIENQSQTRKQSKLKEICRSSISHVHSSIKGWVSSFQNSYKNSFLLYLLLLYFEFVLYANNTEDITFNAYLIFIANLCSKTIQL